MVSQDVLSAHNKGQLWQGLQQLLQQVQQQLVRGAARQKQQQQEEVAAARTRLRVQGMRCEGW
jgi:hypothetical protein